MVKGKKEEIKRIGLPNFQILEFVVKSAEGSPMIMESKKGAEKLMMDLYGESMDPKRKAGLKEQRPGGKAASSKGVPKGRTDEVLRMEFEYSQYRVEGEKDSYGIPSAGFRKSLIDIAKNKAMGDLSGTDISRNIWVLADCVGTYGDALTRIRCSKPYQDMDMGLNSGLTGAPRVISRSAVEKWEATIRVRFNADRFEPEEILSLFAIAGVSDGYGGKRLGKGYENGEYHIQSKPSPKMYPFVAGNMIPKINTVA